MVDGRASSPLLEVRDLVMVYPERAGRARQRPLPAVNGVSLEIWTGETLALVGESGCGKTTTGASILRLVAPTTGTVLFDGVDVLNADRRQLGLLRRRMQVVFQDPLGAMDPRVSVAKSVGEGLRIQRLCPAREARARVDAILDAVGLRPELGDRLPHELSGGQLQRAAIARALVVGPDFVVCDEPLSALDVSVQAEIVNLLVDLQEQRQLTYLFISHDLGVVRHLASRVAVMYLGRIVETGATDDIFNRPQHPYTQALLASIPSRDRTRDPQVLRGDPTDGSHANAGCSFCPRCPEAVERCTSVAPELTEVEPGRSVACLLRV